MSKSGCAPSRHTGRTERGNTRDVKVKRVGSVTIYRRGKSYWLYYRESGKSIRRKIDGNLAVAEATAGKIVQSLAEKRATQFAYEPISPQVLIERFIDYVETVQKLAIGTSERYRAALTLFVRFCEEAGIKLVEKVDELDVDDFVSWIRTQQRTRNGSRKGKRTKYSISGIRFMLSTCRTAFNWARRRKLYPPYQENPFRQVGNEALKDHDQDEGDIIIFSPDQERAFFDACDEWQKGLFAMLAAYGMRVGELTHLLIEDVDFDAHVIRIRSKPELYWFVKTRRRRDITMTLAIETLLRDRIGSRKAGFVFLERTFYQGERTVAETLSSPEFHRRYFQEAIRQFLDLKPDAKPKHQRNHVLKICRTLGWIAEKRVREEFMKLTQQIGCPEFTRAHNIRHLFISRSQEAGTNVFLVADVVGQTSIDTTRRYTHLGPKAKREALTRLLEGPTNNSDATKIKADQAEPSEPRS